MPNWTALPSQGQQWVDDIQRAGQAEGVDPYLLAALVWAESTFNPNAGSPAGAYGLAQLMPGTAAGMGINYHDPYQNLLGGARYLSQQLDRFGRVDYALAAYNAGPGRVAQAGGIPNIDETENYVRKVLEYWRALGGGGSGTYDADANAMAPGTAVSKVPKIPQMSGGTVAGRLLDAMVAKKQAGGTPGEPVTPQQVVPEGKLPAAAGGAMAKEGLREIGIAETEQVDEANIAEDLRTLLDSEAPTPEEQEEALAAAVEAPAEGGAWGYVPTVDASEFRQQGLQANAARGAAIARAFGFDGSIGGVGARPNASDHPSGNATDFMVGIGNPLGDTMAEYFITYAAALGLKYLIWEDRIWTPSKGWRAYTHPNGPTSNATLRHLDHVHASWY